MIWDILKQIKKVHPFIEPDFTLHLVSDKDHLAVAKKELRLLKHNWQS